MAWTIASIPFWIFGAFFLFAAPNSIVMRKPDETAAELGGQFLGSLLISGVAFYIAARIVS